MSLSCASALSERARVYVVKQMTIEEDDGKDDDRTNEETEAKEKPCDA
jgi:hypothetical protein